MAGVPQCPGPGSHWHTVREKLYLQVSNSVVVAGEGRVEAFGCIVNETSSKVSTLGKFTPRER